MTQFNHDISAAPRGRHETKTRIIDGKEHNYDVFTPEKVLIVDETGKVFGTYWVEPGKYSKNGRWSGWCEGQEPIAWAPWPTYDLTASPQQQGTDDDAIAEVKGNARLANATGVEPSSSNHFHLEDAGSGA
jgi:hypothetical protein